MSQDRAQGTFNRGKGVVKEQVGKLVGDRSTEWSGKADQVKGKIQETITDAKDTRRFADGRVR